MGPIETLVLRELLTTMLTIEPKMRDIVERVRQKQTPYAPFEYFERDTLVIVIEAIRESLAASNLGGEKMSRDENEDKPFDPSDPAMLGLLLPRSGTVVSIPPTVCCGIEWHSDSILLGIQPDGRNVGWTRRGQCGVCEKVFVKLS